MKTSHDSFYQRIKPLLVVITFLGLLYNCSLTSAQTTLPVGTWRVHPSYFGPGKLTGSEKTLFYQATEGIFYLSLGDSSMHTLTVLDGLATQKMGAAVFYEPSKTLLIAHEDGSVDFVTERNVRTNRGIKNNALLSEKRINNLVLSGDNVYVLGDFGVGIMDVLTRDFLNTWTNLGPDGTPLTIYDLAEDASQIYLATASGVLTGSKNDNLNDFRNWNLSTFPEAIEAVSILGEKLVVLSQGSISIQEGETFDELFVINNIVSLRKFGFQTFILSDGVIYELNENADFQEVYRSQYANASDFIYLGEHYFLAVPGLGIVPQNGRSFIPQGPAYPIEMIETTQQGIFALGKKIGEQEKLAEYENGNWVNREAPGEVIAVESFANATYIGTTNQGLWKSLTGGFEEVSLGITGVKPPIRVLAVDTNHHLWMGLFTNENTLIRINNTGQVERIQVPGLRFPKDMVVDQGNNLWILQELPGGTSELRIFNPETGLNRVINPTISFSTISSIALDLNQNLWIGTGTGVFFIPFANNIRQESNVNAQQPFVGNRPLLGGSQVNSIAIGPDQSLFIGTKREGVWQYKLESEAVVNTFTASNSPLVNNQINQVAIDWEFGELFIVQEETTFSLRTGTNRAADTLTKLKIYPNPVRPDFTGLLSIEGLTDFATVKITTSVGRVVFSTTVRGGQVAWNIREVLGGSLQSGVYLVFVLDEDGTERIAGKFVVI